MDPTCLKNLTYHQAELVYRVLASRVGAPNGGHSPEAFIQHFSGEEPAPEWRFYGSLGFGGKFRFPRFTVDCYSEDETPERLAAIALANAELGRLREEFLLEAGSPQTPSRNSP